MAMNFMNLLKSAGGKVLVLSLVTGLLLTAHAAEQKGTIALRKDSPQSYTVKKGDTLWDIAARFLEQPWLWPQVWQVNPQIQNPDLIYPGDLISLSYQDGKPVLSLNREQGQSQQSSGNGGSGVISADIPPEVAGIRTEHRSPEVRKESLLSPIPAIPLSKVFAFLNKSSVVDDKSFENAPYLLAEEQDRRVFSAGNEVFARGTWSPNLTTYDIVREGRRITDPDTRKLLGVESIMIGSATIVSYNGDRAVMKIDSSIQEAKAGDRLIPRQKLAIDDSYLPTPPSQDIEAGIASIGGGHDLAGQYDTLVLNQGEAEGLKPGHLLAIQKPSLIVTDEITKNGILQKIGRLFGKGKSRKVEYPGENIGTVLIYRVFDHASLALVLNANKEISLSDRAATP